MYLITNRALNTNKKGLAVFAKTPNPEGPNELRLMRVTKTNGAWRTEAVADKLTAATVKSLQKKYKLEIDISKPWYGSLQVACDLFEQASSQNKSILFFIHGYNNDVDDVMKAAEEIEKLYGVIVVPFTWPANGGGAISGTASYLSDKADARASSGALNRVVGKIQQLHLILNYSMQKSTAATGEEKTPE